MRHTLLLALLLALTCASIPSSAQDAISAKSGMVNYFEGKVLLNGETLTFDRAKFPQIPAGGTLEATQEGRAEVLLAPGVLMWVGEGSKVELVSDDLLNAKVRLLGGNVVISGTEFTDEMSLTVLVNDDTVQIRKTGIYRFESSPASIYIYDGEASILRASGDLKLKKGKTLALSQPEPAPAKFDKEETTSLLAWAQSRDSQIQLASLSSARSLGTGGYPTLSYSSMGGYGYWLYNPYFGMYSFVPANGMMMSPWGYSYYSPRLANDYYSAYAYSGGAAASRRAASSSVTTRGGFGAENNGYGFSRGASSMGMGGYDGGRSMGGMSSGGYSRGASSSGGSASSSAGSVPTSSGGASMGRGGSSAGRGGSGGGRN